MEGLSPSTHKLNTTWKILLIDDDEDDYFITRSMLNEARGKKYDIHWAATYEAGREAIFSDGYDAILVDYDLGLHTGIDLIREANQRGYQAPLILFTGRGNYEVDVEAMRAGATLYLTKNEANPLLLERSIRYAIELKLKEQALRESEVAIRDREAREREKVLEMDAILDAVPAIVWVTHDADCCVVTGNRAAYEFQNAPLGRNISLTSREGMPQTLRVLKDGVELAPDQLPLQRVAATGKPLRNFEEEIVFEDGRHVHLLGNVTPLLSEDGKPGGAIAAFIDITGRKRMEEALRENEQRVHKLFDSMQEIFFVCEILLNEDGKPVDYRYLDVNSAFVQRVGRSREGIIGHTYLELFSSSATYQDWLGRVANVALNGEPAHFEQFAEETGRTYVVNAYSPQHGQFAAVLTDITERKQAEQRWQDSERQQQALTQSLEEDRSRLSAVLDNLPVGVWIADRNGRLVEKNNQADRIWAGNSPLLENIEQYSQYSAWFADSGEPLSPDEYPVARALLTGQPVAPVELKIRRFDGTEGTVLVSAAPVLDQNGSLSGAIGVNMDISERKQVEEELRRSDERFRHLADAMPQLVWTARADGVVDYYNKRYLEYDGIAPAEGEYWEWGPALHPEDLQPTIDAWSTAVKTGEIYQIEHRVQMRDGSYRWHLSRGIPIKDEEGRVIRWFGTATDIDDQKQTEVRLRHSNRELEQFAFVASHDLQEPLRKIIWFGDSLRKRLSGTLDEESSDYLDRIQNAAERMQSMINGLLELSRVSMRRGDFQPVDLTRVGEEVVSDLEPSIQAMGGKVAIEPLPTIEADALQMRQLFQNLIGNAIKFHQPGIPPVVRVSGAVTQPAHSPIVVLRVEDNGIGFEQRHAEQVFQPFQRLHGRSKYEGTGLGLAICQRIVERHHGKIEVQSEPGIGTVFTISLPLTFQKVDAV